MLSIENFITAVFCYVDDYFKNLSEGYKLRTRGFAPVLYDSEVITMEIVGEFLGYDTDRGIWEYFLCHWMHLFPAIGCRTSFVRQAANLWFWKILLYQKFAGECGAYEDDIHLADGFPVPVCHFRRAFFSKIFKGYASYGHCAAKNEKYYGFKGHILISLTGTVTAFTLTAADRDERDVLPELLPGVCGLVIGDKGYISKALRDELIPGGIDLQTPFRKNMKDGRDPRFVRTCVSVRRQVETVIGQLCDRFSIQKTRARDIRHMTCRITRKILSHTVAVFINRLHGREPLQFDGIIVR